MRPACAKMLLSLLAVAAAVGLAAAEDAPHGAYLGCFQSNALNTPYQVSTVSKATLTSCAPACADANYGLVFITTDYKCYCSNTVPAQNAQLKYSDCLPGKPGVAAFYLHKDASSTLCRVSNPPMSSTTWKVAYGRENVEFNADDNSVAIKLNGLTGARLDSKDGKFLYGIYQIDGKIADAPGVVSSYYTRSSDVYPNSAVSDFSEIDWEFCNGVQCEPDTIWLNSYTKAQSCGERKVTASEYQKLLGSSDRTGTSWTTYTLNWQPDFVAWVLNGTTLQKHWDGVTYTVNVNGASTQKEYHSPDLASMQVLTVWTDARSLSDGNFGGVVDLSKGPYYSYFRNMRRVVCDQPMPTDAEIASVAMGPAWLYGRAETVSSDNATAIEQESAVVDKWVLATDTTSVADNKTWTSLTGASLTNASLIPANITDTAKNINAGGLAAPSKVLSVLAVLTVYVFALLWR